jgi:hypothetical protein
VHGWFGRFDSHLSFLPMMRASLIGNNARN